MRLDHLPAKSLQRQIDRLWAEWQDCAIPALALDCQFRGVLCRLFIEPIAPPEPQPENK